MKQVFGKEEASLKDIRATILVTIKDIRHKNGAQVENIYKFSLETQGDTLINSGNLDIEDIRV